MSSSRRGFLGALLAGSAGTALAGVAHSCEKMVEVEQKLIVTENIAEEFEKAKDDARTLIDMRNTTDPRLVQKLFYPDQWEPRDRRVCEMTPGAYSEYLHAHQDVNKKFGLDGASCHSYYL